MVSIRHGFTERKSAGRGSQSLYPSHHYRYQVPAALYVARVNGLPRWEVDRGPRSNWSHPGPRSVESRRRQQLHLGSRSFELRRRLLLQRDGKLQAQQNRRRGKERPQVGTPGPGHSFSGGTSLTGGNLCPKGQLCCRDRADANLLGASPACERRGSGAGTIGKIGEAERIKQRETRSEVSIGVGSLHPARQATYV